MKQVNRVVVLIAGMLIQFCAGIIYMWSVFRDPVAAHLSWDAGAAALTSSVMLASFVVGIVFGGRLQDKFGPRPICILGSVLIAAGMVLTSRVTAAAPQLIYLTYGVVGGLGVGSVYTSTVSAIQKWFPDKRGFATGMTVSAFGFSLVVFTPLANMMLSGMGVPNTFLTFGLSFLVICGLCSLIIQNPPKGYAPAGFTPATSAKAQAASDKKQYTAGEMLKTREFYCIFGSMFLLLPAYFILNPLIKTLGMDRGLSESVALLGVMITGIANASGRLLMSWLSDKLGRKLAMMSLCVGTLIAAIVMIFANGPLFLVCIALIAFCFGGSSGVYAAVTADYFGTKNMGTNYGLVMVAFGSSALIFQMLSNALSAGGNYAPSFIVAAVTCVASLILVSLLRKPEAAGK